MAMNMATQTEFSDEAGQHGTRVLKQPPTPAELADKFPQLEILELLGRGGMGAVYKVRQKELDRIVALKILPPGIGDDPGFAERFTREAKALGKLHHPNIVTLFEFGRADGLFFFLMEYVDGVNLRQLLETGRIASREALAIVPQICDALQFAHDHGIVHRDIKPENILMDRRGRVKVADFGLAKIVGVEGRARHSERAEHAQNEDGVTRPTSELTEAGKVMGTPQYMAPEQKDHPLEVDHRADIYALGVVFYQMLTGELPGKQIEAPSTKVHIDVRLDEIVLRALESKPELRYQQASVLKTKVESIAGESPQEVHTSAERSSQSAGKIIAALCSLFFFGGMTVGLLAVQSLRAGPRGEIALFWILLLALPFVAMALRKPISRWQKITPEGKPAGTIWFRSAAIATSVMALMVGGFAIFFLDAAASDTNGWNPQLKEAIFVITIFVGAILLPISAWILFSASATCPKGNPLQRELVSQITGRRWIQMILFAAAIFFFAIGIWKLTQFDLKPHELFFGVFLVCILALVTAALGFLAFPASASLEKIPAPTKSKTWRTALRSLVVALFIALLLRTFVLGFYFATNDAVSPEIPRGSRVLVFKLTHSFEAGDVVVYKSGQTSMLGRVAGEIYDGDLPTRPGDPVPKRVRDRVLIERRGEDPKEIPASDIIGKVIFNTRVSTLSKAPISGEIRMITAAPFTANFDGGTVELVGLAPHPSTNGPAWLPSGAPADEVFPFRDGQSRAAGKVMKEIAFRIHSLMETASLPVTRFEPDSVGGMGAAFFGKDTKAGGARFFVQAIGCPPGLQRVNVQLGVADGEWETVRAVTVATNKLNGSAKMSRDDGVWEIEFEAVRAKSAAEFAVSFSLSRKEEWETRVVGVKGSGALMLLQATRGDGVTGLNHGLTLISERDFSEITAFELQRRKYQWMTFRNVALEPGQTTAIGISDATANATISSRNETAEYSSLRRKESKPLPDFAGILPDGSFVELNVESVDRRGSKIRFLDFEKNGVIEAPREFDLGREGGGWTRTQKENWLKEKGIDLMVMGNGLQPWRLLIPVDNELKLVRVPAEIWRNTKESDWSELKPERGEALQFIDVDIELIEHQLKGRATHPDHTFLFTTADGTRGLLRFTGHLLAGGGDQIGLKLLFKKLPSTVAEKPASVQAAKLLPQPVSPNQKGSASNPVYVWCDRGSTNENKVMLPHGGSVRLYAVGDGTAWWTPQGESLPDKPDWQRFRENFRQNWPDSHLLCVFEIIHPGATPPSAKIGPVGEVIAIPYLTAVGISTTNNPAWARIGFGVGEWQTGLDGKGSPEPGFLNSADVSCRIESVKTIRARDPKFVSKGQTEIRFWLLGGSETEAALVAVGKKGEETAVAYTYAPTDIPSNPNERWILVGWVNMEAEEIERFELRTRPRNWATFVGLAKKPVSALDP